MMRFYLAALGGGAIFFAYVIGQNVGNVRCDARIANEVAERIATDTKFMENTNEVVLHTGVDDVRRILRAKYTIAE